MPKDIAYITHYAHIPSRDADAICVMNTCHALAKQGLSLTLIIPAWQGDTLDDIAPGKESIWKFYNITENFLIKRIKGRFLYKLGFIGRYIYKLYAILIAAREHEIIYVRHVENALMSSLLGYQTVLAYHDTSFLANNQMFKLLLKLDRLLQLKLRFISVTHNGKKLLESWGIRADRILVAPNGVDFSHYQSNKKSREELKLPENKIIVGFSGSLFPGRGIEEIIDSAIWHPELHFIVLGGSLQDIKRCKKYAHQKDVNNVHFLGFVSHDQVPLYLLATDILIMPYTSQTPTHKDMSPMKMFDYMASGKPIIATNFPVIQEILHHQRNSLLVKPDSGDAIAEAIQWCLDNPESAAQLGLQAQKDSKEYTWKKRAEKITSWMMSTNRYFV
jgi:glycosyltransferase involved in cell wall biosynthesis